MARHAGFAVAVTVAEAYVNQTLWAVIADAGPLAFNRLFALPPLVSVGASGLRISGLALFEERPTVHLAPNAANLISIDVAVVVHLAATLDPGLPIDLAQPWRLRLTGSARAKIDVELAGDGIYLRWVPAETDLGSLGVTLLDGPPIPGFLAEAMAGPVIHDVVSAALRAMPPTRVSDRLYGRVVERTQPIDIASVGLSRFDWFVIHETISRASVRILDGAVAVGIDLDGMTNGDPAQLVNLRQQVGEGMAFRTPADQVPPILVPFGGNVDDGDIDVLINSDVLTRISEKISAQVGGTPVAPGITLGKLRLSTEMFDKPLRGREIGLCLSFTVHHSVAGNIDGRVFLQPYISTDATHGDNWLLYVALADIDLPWWVDVVVTIVSVALAVTYPITIGFLAVGLFALFDGLIPGAIGNVTAQGQQALGRGMVLAAGTHDGTLATRLRQPTSTGVTRVKLNPDGVDVHMITVAPSLRFGQSGGFEVATLGATLDGDKPAPYVFGIWLADALASISAQCSVRLIVRRADTGAEVARAEGPYADNRMITLDHLTAELYLVGSFVLEARLFLGLNGITSLLFAKSMTFAVSDPLQRAHPFVTWPTNTAHFKSPEDPTKWWSREARHTLHRTAVSARCVGLRQRCEQMKRKPNLEMNYSDDLGFTFAELQQHRPEVCDFCFFGHPNGNSEFPQEDWFKR